MAEHNRNRARLRKEISSIFTEASAPHSDKGRKSSGTPAPERTAYIRSKSSTLEKKKRKNLKVNKASQSLPEAAPVTRPKASSITRHKPVPTEHPKVVSAERNKVMPTKKQKAVYIQYLKTAGVVWAACFVILLLTYVLILRPQKNSRKLIGSRLAEKKQVYESALRAAKKETKIRLNQQIERLQNRLRDFVVDFEDSANLTFKISQIADEKEVASFSIKGKDNLAPSGEPARKYISENHIVISFMGGFNQFATFLNSLERHRPVLLVDKFTITRSGQDDSAFRVSLNVATFVRKQQDDTIHGKQWDQVNRMKI